MGNARQLAASLRLTRWLRCRYGIGPTTSSATTRTAPRRYHRERVERLKTQTHGDLTASTMRTYRSKLVAKGAC